MVNFWSWLERQIQIAEFVFCYSTNKVILCHCLIFTSILLGHKTWGSVSSHMFLLYFGAIILYNLVLWIRCSDYTRFFTFCNY